MILSFCISNFSFVKLRINSTIQIVEFKEALRTSNALEILRKYP